MMNIVISINAKYVDAAENMLFSLRQYTTETISVWLINHSLSNETTGRFERYLKKINIELNNIKIEDSFFDSMPLPFEGLFSVEIYYRLLIPWILPENVNRALWLDADLIVKGDITPFYYKNFNGHCIVACDDGRQMNMRTRNEDKERLMLGQEHRYFNSGVLLMNTELIRQRYTLEYIFSLSEELRDKLIYPDQDILNYWFQNSVLYENPYIYNCSTYMLSEMSEKEYDRVRIIHYYGPNKPWNLWSGDDPGMNYWTAKRQRGNLVIVPFLIFNLRNRLRKITWLRKLYHCIRRLKR